jgi:hypothetical protein
MKEITKEQLVSEYDYYLTVGKLKDFLSRHDFPDDAKVLVQRVEDIYYENHGWGVYLKESEFPLYDEFGKPDPKSMNQYHPAWACVKYSEEDNDLFIDMHY